MTQTGGGESPGLLVERGVTMDTYIREIDGRWYAFAGDTSKNQVYSIGQDCPEDGTWAASWTDGGIRYVATWSPTREAAYRKARRNGNYCGEA